MRAVAKQRGDTWPVSDEGRMADQWRFVRCWLVLVGVSVVCSQTLELCGLHLTPSSVADGDDEFVFTHLQVYDDWGCYISLLGLFFVLLSQRCAGVSVAEQWRTVGRNLVPVSAFGLFLASVQGLRYVGAITFKPSGHIALYVLTSYQHFHNAKSMRRDIGLQLPAILLLGNLPFEMYCSVWTVLVFHSAIEVSIALGYSVGVTYILHSLSLDS